MEAAEGSSIDLLQRFAGSTVLSDRQPPRPAVAPSSASGEMELSLGLSLGGCFSSTPTERTGNLVRSSSIASFPVLDGKDEIFQAAPAPLQRTCSLPGRGADEDCRKRKELQSLKRLEARRKRSEKRNCLKVADESGGGFQWQPSSWRPPTSHGSIGSVGSSSSMQGFDLVKFSNGWEAKSPSSMPGHPSPGPQMEETKKLGRRGSGMGEVGKWVMEEMPSVSTNGPNGKRVEGFLYKYGEVEEVRIVCICHGSFLSPAEFVRHAGGGDVDQPLRHIVVSPPSPFL